MRVWTLAATVGVVVCVVACVGAGIEVREDCIVNTDCRGCLLEAQAECGWCAVEGKCSELNADGTIACRRGQTIFTGYCPDGSVPNQGFFERKDSDKGGFTHGYVGLALFLAVLVLWRIFRTWRGRKDKAAGKAHRRQDEAWRVMRQFRAQVEMDKRKNKKLRDAGFLYDIHYAEPPVKTQDTLVQPAEHIVIAGADDAPKAAAPGPSASRTPVASGGVAPPPPPPPPVDDADDGAGAGVAMTPLARETEVQLAQNGGAYMNYDASLSSSSDAEDGAAFARRQAPPVRLRRRDESFGSPTASSDSSGSGYSSGPPSSSSGPPPRL